MTPLTDFLRRVRDELVRSLGDTLGLFGEEGGNLRFDVAELFVRLLVGGLVVLIFWLAFLVIRRALLLIVSRVRLPIDVTRPLVMALRTTLALLAGLAVLSQFGVSRELLGATALAALFAFAFYIAWIVTNRLLTNTIRNYQLDRSLEQLLRNVLAVLIGAFAFVTVLGQFGIQVISILAGLGVAGIAVGFAAQDTLSNFIAGITLLVERPFRIGDWVELNGQVGKVDEISLRTTRLITRDNELTSIPNASVASSEIVNLSGGGPLRVTIPIGIAYKESARAAREVMLPVLRAHAAVLAAPGREPSIQLSALGDSSVDLLLRYWISPENIDVQPAISAELLERCKEVLDDAGIEIPFPHLQLFIDEAKGLESLVVPGGRG